MRLGRIALAFIGAGAVLAIAAEGPVTMDPGAAAPGPPLPSAINSAVIEKGKAQFEAACSACHGVTARGGRAGAPDLLLSAIVMDDAGRFRAQVRAGSPARGMPPFAFDDETLDAIQAHLNLLGAAARRRGEREPDIVGNSARGRKFFEGKGGCSGCHSVAGDLQGVGARYKTRVLQGRIVLPRGSGVHPGLLARGIRIPGVTDQVPVNDSPSRVSVTAQDGSRSEGVLIYISDFEVALRDSTGRYRSFARSIEWPRVQMQDPAQAHIDRMARLSDRDLNDLTAYLSTIK